MPNGSTDSTALLPAVLSALLGLLSTLHHHVQLFIPPGCMCRATWLGSGGFSAHWTGDTLSSEADMQWTIPSILNNGLAGITFSGADICGFSQYASENLCARWAALGAWYPFSRNHHADGFQEFYRRVLGLPSWHVEAVVVKGKSNSSG